MQKVMEIVSLLLNFILGSGMLGVLVFYSSKRRKAQAEASSAEVDARGQELSIQRENIEFLASQLQEAWAEVEKLQTLLNSKRDQIVSLIAQTKKLEIELIECHSSMRRAELASCSRVECPRRIITEL